VLIRQIMPRVAGFGRVGHQDVVRLFRAWLLVALQRFALWTALYAPFVLVFLWITSALAAPSRFTFIVVAPTAGLLLRYWFLTVIECTALYADERQVIGPASPENAWHHPVHDYLLGYLRRSGSSLDRRLLKQILFLPGKRNGIHCYGGGLTRSRIVIDPALLELALGGTEKEDTLVEHEFSWSDWTSGYTLPDPAASRAKTWQLGAVLAARVRDIAAAGTRVLRPALLRRRPRRPTTELEPVRRRLGQAPTLLGRVAPAEPDEPVPLLSDNPKDLAALRELLAEQVPWLFPDPDEEQDPTDPSNRDFLFGVLAVELGRIQRDENQLPTLAAALEGARGLTGFVLDQMGNLYRRWLSRYPAMLADAYAALNLAGDHLVQYLLYLQTSDPTPLSARADRDQLASISRRAFAEIRGVEPGSDVAYLGASTRKRLVWASQFSSMPLADERGIRVRRIALVGALVAAAAMVAIAILRAVAYHPTYLETLAEEQQRLEKNGEEN
jgi:hypothetical protein